MGTDYVYLYMHEEKSSTVIISLVFWKEENEGSRAFGLESFM